MSDRCSPSEIPSCYYLLADAELKPMLKFMKNGTCLLPFIIFATLYSSVAVSQSIKSQKQPSSKSAPDSAGPMLQFGTGLGFFPDINIEEPLAGSSRRSEDGTSSSQERTDTHIGVPLSLKAGYSWNVARFSHVPYVDYIHLSKLDNEGSDAQRRAGYRRFTSAWRSTWSMLSSRESVAPFLMADLGFRRTMYTNISSGHCMDTVLPILGVGSQFMRVWSAEIYGGQALYSDFGYNDGKSFANKPVENTKADLYTYGLGLAYLARSTSRVKLDIEKEVVDLTVADIHAYEQYGFNVAGFRAESRSYHLETLAIKLGFAKQF